MYVYLLPFICKKGIPFVRHVHSTTRHQKNVDILVAMTSLL